MYYYRYLREFCHILPLFAWSHRNNGAWLEYICIFFSFDFSLQFSLSQCLPHCPSVLSISHSRHPVWGCSSAVPLRLLSRLASAGDCCLLFFLMICKNFPFTEYVYLLRYSTIYIYIYIYLDRHSSISQ